LLRSVESLPPRHQRIDAEIARLRGTAEGHLQLCRVFIDAPARHIFFFAPQVRITGLVITTGISPARECPNIDRSGSVHMTQDTCGKQVLPTSSARCSPASCVSRKSSNARRAIMPRWALSPVWGSKRSI
jgi:hypothetical protein